MVPPGNSVSVTMCARANSAVAVTSAPPTVITHTLPLRVVQPIQPLKTEPAWATGVRRTSSPCATDCVVPAAPHAAPALPQAKPLGTAKM
ncbi:hypothetical protein D3C72_1515570 [compost metagenome]